MMCPTEPGGSRRAVWVTISFVGSVLFIFGLAAVGSWSQKRQVPRIDPGF